MSLRLHLARPRPAPDVGDRLLVDGDDGDLVRGRLGRHLHAQVVGPAFDPRDESRDPGEPEEDDGDHEAEEPVGLPECGLHELSLEPPPDPAILPWAGSRHHLPISTSVPMPRARASLRSSAAMMRSCIAMPWDSNRVTCWALVRPGREPRDHLAQLGEGARMQAALLERRKQVARFLHGRWARIDDDGIALAHGRLVDLLAQQRVGAGRVDVGARGDRVAGEDRRGRRCDGHENVTSAHRFLG